MRLRLTEPVICAHALIAGAVILTTAPAAAYERWFNPYPAAQPGPGMRASAPVKPRIKRKHQRETKDAKIREPGKISGPLHIIISIKQQRLTLYANGVPVAQSPVSTGVAGHPTPQGVFSVIQKNRFHRSNIYSDAPMPFMQRITWSGVAMHEGRLPGYPASHGCIRLPAAFAQRLWGITRIGARVIIAQDDVAPTEIASPRLIALGPVSKIADAAPPARIRLATAIISDTPLKGSIDAIPDTRGDEGRVESAIDRTVRAGMPDGENFSSDERLIADLLDKGDLTASPKDPLLRPGPISIYISRKQGRLYVRKGFEPVFETPVTIEGGQPLGMHVFTALGAKDGVTRWTVLSLPIDRTVKKGKYIETTTRSGETLRKELMPPVYETQPPGDPNAALERITIPESAVSRIAALMSPGASLIVSDLSPSHETGERGTDFIVLTR